MIPLRRPAPGLATLALLLLGTGTAPADDSGGSTADDPFLRTQQLLQQPREVPDDPPGVPARTRGKTRRPRVQSGSTTSIQVNVDASGFNVVGDAANEPSIAVDPTFPNHMAIGWRQFATINSNFRQAGVAFSRDGGRTWTVNGPLDPNEFRSDPVLAWSRTGTFYYNSLKGSDFTCQVFESNDGGQSWGPAIPAQGGDKAWMTVDRTGGIGDGHLYEAWSTAAGCCGTNTFSRSTNGNLSWDTATSIPQYPRWGTMDVAPNGYLWIAGVGSLAGRILVSSSIDAQNASYLPLFFTSSVNIAGDVVAGLGGSPNPDGLLGQVFIAVDPSSGPRAGWIYAVVSVDPPGDDPMDVHFVRSTDNGINWSTPVRLNDDPFTDAWQWMATMSVAPNGRIDVVWNDTRNTGVVNQSELFTTSSSNGGTTWSANEQISPAWDSWVGWPNQNKIGDYYHMISDDVGAHLAWAATFNGEQDVYYLRIGDYDCNGNGVADSLDIASLSSADLNDNGIPDECEEDFSTSDTASRPPTWRLHPNVPNPFNPVTRIAFEVARADATIRLEVFDVQGRLVRTLVHGRREVGRQSVQWFGRDDHGRALASGVYVARLQAGGTTQTQRMVLVR
jgi:hypothetical protein